MFLCIIFFLKLSWRPTSANPRRRSLSVAVEVRFTAAVQRWGFDAPTINNGWCPIHWQKQSYLHVQPIWIKLQQIIFFISYQRRAKMRPWMAIGLENPAKTSVLLGSHHLFLQNAVGFQCHLDCSPLQWQAEQWNSGKEPHVSNQMTHRNVKWLNKRLSTMFQKLWFHPIIFQLGMFLWVLHHLSSTHF